MSTKIALKKAGLKTALIIDDGYDRIPQSNDIDASDWATFWSDLNEDENNMIDEIYPEGQDARESDLQDNNAFIAALWQNKGRFRNEIPNALFGDYENASRVDHAVLSDLKARLDSHGLQVKTSGRSFEGKAKDVDLLVVDMFWGTPQKASDKEEATDALSVFLRGRSENPPAIVLMSSNSRIYQSRDKFRDDAGIFEAGFGVIKKADIKKPERLPRVLRELSYSRKDALKLNTFVNSWQKSLANAVTATEKDIRKIDLHDWAQIDDLLLDQEKVSKGNYMLNIFDNVLQYEIEREPSVISSAKALNDLNTDRYPPMAAPSSRDTVSILSKTLYRHPLRRKLIPKDGYPVQFGDILALKKGARPLRIFKGLTNPVFFVMTPACDLIPRGSGMATHVTLIAGEYQDLDDGIAGGSVKPLQTPVLELDRNMRVKVNWNPANIISLTNRQLKSLLGKNGPGRVVAQMREVPANALQQQILSKLGRIATTAPLPSTFAAAIQIYYLDKQKEPVRLNVDGHNPIDGICYVGRDQHGGQKKNVPFNPDAYTPLYDALSALTVENVDRACFGLIQRILAPHVFERLFSHGVSLKNTQDKPMPMKLLENNKDTRLGTVLHNLSIEAASAGQAALTGLIIKIETKQF